MNATGKIALGQDALPPVAGGVSIGTRLTALWTVYVLTLRQHLRGRRWIAMALLFLVPTALAAMIRFTTDQVPEGMLEFLLVFMLMPHALLPLAALVYASGIIRDEQEEQTLTYLLVRPISKWALYLVKLLAAISATVTLVAIFTALAYLVIYTGANAGEENIALRAAKAIVVQALAVTTYCSLFGLMGLLTRQMLAWGLLYIFVIEGWMANMPFSIRLVTVVYYARLIAYRLMSFVVVSPGGNPGRHGRTEDLAAEAWQIDVVRDPELLAHPSASTCALVLLLASLALALLGAFFCSQREFYVKTPETNKS